MNIQRNTNSDTNFGACKLKKAWRKKHNIPLKVTSDWIGWTDPKKYAIPTTSNLLKNYYPDITNDYNKQVKSCVDFTLKNLGKNKVINFFKKCITFFKNFKAGDPWDTKQLESFHGYDRNSKRQYAILNGKIVSTNYVSNRLYSEVGIRWGFPKWMIKLGAQFDAHGLSNLFFDKKIPTIPVKKSKTK